MASTTVSQSSPRESFKISEEEKDCGISRASSPRNSWNRQTSACSHLSRETERTVGSAYYSDAELSQKADDVQKKWKAQDPGRYIIAVGTLLAACAGFVNVTAFMVCGGFVSHVTGTTARLGMAIEGYYTDDMPHERMFQAGLTITSFLLGAMLCGLLVSRNEVHFGNSAYGVVLFINCLILLGAVAAVDADTPESWPVYLQAKFLALYLMAAACGLQNGMCTAHFGACVRTTHLTGLMTDSGLTIGRLVSILLRTRCQRRNFTLLDSAEVAVDLKKLVIFFFLLAGYVSGVCSGAHVADILGINALVIPAFITGSGGLVYTVAKARCWQAFERAEAEKFAMDLEEAEQIFERARNHLHDARKSVTDFGPCSSSSSASNGLGLNFDALGGEVGKALSLLHDMELSLHDRLVRSSSFSDGKMTQASSRRDNASPESARRIVSAPSLMTLADLKERKLAETGSVPKQLGNPKESKVNDLKERHLAESGKLQDRLRDLKERKVKAENEKLQDQQAVEKSNSFRPDRELNGTREAKSPLYCVEV